MFGGLMIAMKERMAVETAFNSQKYNDQYPQKQSLLNRLKGLSAC
ncbi:MAG: hypothetical protein ACI9EX_000556 [Oleispira sp.]|jgi:hypothetical protein